MHFVIVVAFALFAAATQAQDSDRVRFGLQSGFSVEQGHLFGSGESSGTRLALLQPQMSVALLQTQQGRPAVELVTEYTAAWSLRPIEGKFLHFLSIGGRFHVRPTRPVGGYLELGAGMGDSALFTDPADPNPRENPVFRQLTGRMQYHLQVGGGVRLDVGVGCLLVGYRITHLSNKGAQLPNLGFNGHTVVANYQLRAF